ncbi:MAG: hypothetical protein QUU85_06050, partial [Candidatus Eisenbacteria bacterium]|nr:hypothetical protein [Candidatus Eisenbacteria bacterium]
MHGRDLVLVSANGGITFYHGNNAAARYGLLEPDDRVGAAANAVEQARIDREAASREAGRPLRPSEASAHWFRAGLSSLLADPGHAARLWGWKLIRFAGPHAYADNYSYAVERGDVASLDLFAVPFPLLWIPAVAGLALRPPRDRREGLLVLFAATGLATCLLFYVASRYQCESVPALAILSGRALVSWRDAPPPARLRASIAAAILLAMALVPAGRAAREQDGLCLLYTSPSPRDS